ncbi:hypothetical protein BDN72DRAFT_904124 [Pluteus cervinus]|uniref:Uncharacterized protein n=1 Tax=Pluteus cervinus TaxID=181527 RepID=A0ACD3A6E8_9AGAR|nr:hypothetical protein BDN72DRAFT_904124 [Pluteus cervinus]
MSFTSRTLRSRCILSGSPSGRRPLRTRQTLPEASSVDTFTVYHRPGPVRWENNEPVYEVEGIVGKTERGGQALYRVRWVGYPRKDDTLEPFVLTQAEEDLHKDPNGNYYQRPPPDGYDLDGSPRYKVEHVVEYAAPKAFIQWEGYPEWENTWEDLSHLSAQEIDELMSL